MQTQTYLLKHKFFSLVELLVVMAVLAILLSLAVRSLEKFSSQSENLGCQNKLKAYAMAFGFYLEDYNNKFPTMPWGSNPNSGQLLWIKITRTYPDIFNMTAKEDDGRFCPTFYQTWSSKSNYRGYTGIYSKSLFDIRNPKQVAALGDGIKANTSSGFCFFEIIGISDSSLARDVDDARYRQFHPDDFLHTGQTLNALFVDMHIENMDAFYMLKHKNNIWNR